MKAKAHLKFCFIILGLVCVIFTFCFIDLRYYRECFYPGTTINTHYACGYSVKDFNEILIKDFEIPPHVTVTIPDLEAEFFISTEELQLSVDYTQELNQIFWEQHSHPFLYPFREQSKSNVLLLPKIKVYKEPILEKLEKYQPSRRVEIKQQENHVYELINTVPDQLDIDAYCQEILSAIQAGEFQITLKRAALEPQYNKQELSIIQKFKEINEYQSLKLGIDFGDGPIYLTAQELAEFLVLDEQEINLEQYVTISEEQLTAYVEELAREYDTYERMRLFQATSGGTIEFHNQKYGTLIQWDKLLKELSEAVKHKTSVTLYPQYIKEPFSKGKDDIGDTYVEISLSDQHLYYYHKGELLVDTDVVTGNVRNKTTTPTGIYSIYAKSVDTVLRGADYESFVSYWMPFYHGYGLHDATWRKKFGGEIYLRGGSHGCINMPLNQAEVLYEHLQIGTPVIIYDASMIVPGV